MATGFSPGVRCSPVPGQSGAQKCRGLDVLVGTLVGRSGLGVKTSGVGRGLFSHNPFSKQQCSVQALTAEYLGLNLP